MKAQVKMTFCFDNYNLSIFIMFINLLVTLYFYNVDFAEVVCTPLINKQSTVLFVESHVTSPIQWPISN